MKASVTSNKAYVITCYLAFFFFFSFIGSKGVIISIPQTIVQGEMKASLDFD